MARSRRPSVWIEERKNSSGEKIYRVRAEKDGRRIADTTCGPLRQHAVEKRDQLRAELWGRQLHLKSTNDGKRRLSWLIEHYLAERGSSKSERTVAIDAQELGKLKAFAGNPLLIDLQPDMMRTFKAHLFKATWQRRKGGKERPYHQNAVRITLRTVKTALRWAYRESYIDHDPFRGVDIPAEVPVANPPTNEKIKAMWSHLSLIAKRAFTVFIYCGLRTSELLSIRSEEHLIRPAKPGAPWLLKVRKAKTRRGKVEYKTMALPPEALAAMSPLPASGLVFRIGKRRLTFLLARARRRAGLERIRWHDLRHRWATDLMSVVKDEYAIMQVGGWTSRAAVARYQHPTESRRDSTLQVKFEAIPPLLPPNGGVRKRKKRVFRRESP